MTHLYRALSKGLLSPVAMLGYAYVVGQGSSLGLLLLLRQTSNAEDVGRAVLYLGLFSLCFQFADFGNSPFGLRCIKEGRVARYEEFRVSRGLLAGPFMILTAVITLGGVGYAESAVVISLAVIGATLFGLSTGLYIEANNQYGWLAVLQATPWVLTSSIVLLTFGSNLGERGLLILWLIVPIGHFVTLRRFRPKLQTRRVRFLDAMKGTVFATALIGPVLVGQVWARWMLAAVGVEYGLATLAAIGIVRSIHTGFIVCGNLVMRPEIRRCMTATTSMPSDANEMASRLLRKATPLISVSVLSALCMYVGLRNYSPDISHWSPILLGAPFWIAGHAISASNQAFLSTRIYTGVEVAAMAGHAIIFMFALSYSGILAFVLADVVRFGLLRYVPRLLAGYSR